MLFSIIVPLRKCPLPLLGSTLESIAHQKDAQFEVIIIEAYSCVETQEFMNRYENLQIIETDEKTLDTLIQQGVDAAKGDYLNVLLPGEFYLSHYALQTIAGFIDENNAPDIITCGWMENGKAYFETRIPSLLKKGFYPITLQNYWFKKAIFEKAGKFDPRYAFKGKFDFFCRLNQIGLNWPPFKRALTDSHRQIREPTNPVLESKEMLSILSRHYGILTALRWWCTQNQINFFKNVLKALRKAFFAKG